MYSSYTYIKEKRIIIYNILYNLFYTEIFQLLERKNFGTATGHPCHELLGVLKILRNQCVMCKMCKKYKKIKAKEPLKVACTCHIISPQLREF